MYAGLWGGRRRRVREKTHRGDYALVKRTPSFRASEGCSPGDRCADEVNLVAIRGHARPTHRPTHHLPQLNFPKKATSGGRPITLATPSDNG
jgi:hypothetical protein